MCSCKKQEAGRYFHDSRAGDGFASRRSPHMAAPMPQIGGDVTQRTVFVSHT